MRECARGDGLQEDLVNGSRFQGGKWGGSVRVGRVSSKR